MYHVIKADKDSYQCLLLCTVVQTGRSDAAITSQLGLPHYSNLLLSISSQLQQEFIKDMHFLYDIKRKWKISKEEQNTFGFRSPPMQTDEYVEKAFRSFAEKWDLFYEQTELPQALRKMYDTSKS